MLIKQKSPLLSRKLALVTFGKVLIEFSTKVNLLYLHYSTVRRCYLLHLIKQNYFLKTFLRILIMITPKMTNKVIMNLHLSKASDPDCIPVVVLKNCEPELSYILAELFNKCLKESCFPDCWKVSSVVPVFKNVGERSTAKNYHPASLLSVVSKEELVNNRSIDHLEKCGLFFSFPVWF